MKASMYLLGASAILASASPIRALDKRALETEWVYEVVTVYVTPGVTPVDDVQAKATGNVYLEQPQEPAAEPAPAAPKPVVEKAKPEPKSEPKPEPVYEAPKPVVEKAKSEPKPDPKPEPVYEAPEPTTEKPAPKPEPTYEAPKPVAEKPKPKPKPEPKPEPEPKPVSSASTVDIDLDLDAPYESLMVNYHNVHRRNHTAETGDLEWDDTLAGYAETIAKGCVFEHDMTQGDGGYGQNLASWGATSDIDSLKNKAAAGGVTNQWYNSEMANWVFYGQENPPSGMNIDLYGHFTQLVWKDTKKVGCATVKCPAGSVLSFPSWYTVCNYSPQGNYAGQYGENVLKPSGEKVVSV